jgi:hypothetical protein
MPGGCSYALLASVVSASARVQRDLRPPQRRRGAAVYGRYQRRLHHRSAGGRCIGVATFGIIYLGLVAAPGSASATHAFAVATAAFAIAAVVAAAMAYRATSSPGRITRVHEAGPDADSRSDYAPAHRVTA